MKALRLALLQYAWSGDQNNMMTQIDGLIKRASDSGATMVCLPEFSILPYFPGTRDKSGFTWAESILDGVSVAFFSEMAKTHKLTVIGSIYEKADDGRYYDTATIHTPDGNLSHTTRKVHIPSGEGYHETDFFEGWNEYPVHALESVKMGVPTCYDQWFPELARIYAIKGVEMLFYPTAIGSEPNAPDFDSRDAWQTVMRGHAVANGIYIGAANRVGHENAVTFYGSSFVCDPTGKIIAQAGRDTTEVIVADIEPEIFAQYRQLFPLLNQRKPDKYQALLERYDGESPDWLED